MYGTDMLLGAGLGGLLIGGILAFFWGRSSSDGSQQAREMERKLEQVTKEKKAYEQRVTDHFMETANRLNSLTENYRNIHEHLADGARTLCGDSIEVKVDRLAGGSAEVADNLIDIEPPRDYAPKSSPTEPGMLNERFGMEREDVPPAEHRDTEDAEESAPAAAQPQPESEDEQAPTAAATAQDEHAQEKTADEAADQDAAAEQQDTPADDADTGEEEQKNAAQAHQADETEQQPAADAEQEQEAKEDTDKTRIGGAQG